MTYITRGTTPTIKFTTPFVADDVLTAYVTLAQSGSKILDTNSVTVSDKEVSVVLSQACTLQMIPGAELQAQLRMKMKDGNIVASDIVTMYVNNILKDGEI